MSRGGGERSDPLLMRTAQYMAAGNTGAAMGLALEQLQHARRSP